MSNAAQHAYVEYQPLAGLKPWPGNPKRHDIEKLCASIRRFGFNQPVVVDENSGCIVAGHGRAEALAKLKENGEPAPTRVEVREGDWFVPVLRGVHFESKKDGDGYVIADNRLTEIGGWDDDNLHSLLEQFRGEGDDWLHAMGFDQGQFDSLLNETDTEAQQGLTPEERLERFENAAIKQITIFLLAADFDRTVARMQALMEKVGAENHSDLMLWMLDHCERTA